MSLQKAKQINIFHGYDKSSDIMCESSVFLEEDGDLKEVMQDVSRILFEEDKVICYGLLGDRKEVENAEIKEANLMEHKIVLRRK